MVIPKTKFSKSFWVQLGSKGLRACESIKFFTSIPGVILFGAGE